MKFVFGVDLGGTTVKLAHFDGEGALLSKWEIPTVTENGGAAILPDIARALEQYMARQGLDRSDALGIGIGVPGAADEKGVVASCDNLHWGRLDVKAELSGLTGLPVFVGNDANVAALGESWKGSGNNCANMVMVTLGTGVGGGVILGGRQVCGVHGAAGEIGHMVLEPKEQERCNCGKCGCAEQYCSATGLVRLAKRRMATTGEKSVLSAIEPLTAKDVFDAAKQGDACAAAVLEQFYDYLGQLLANICCVVDPEVIVLGGGVSKAGPMLLEGVQAAFGRYVYHASRSTRFALASLGNDAGVYGAAKLVLGQ